MWLHRARLPQIAREMVQVITADDDIETDAPSEVQRDLEAVLEQYLRQEQDLSDRARDLAAARNLSSREAARFKAELAKDKGIAIGEDAIDYILDQLLEMLMHSGAVEEIFAEDHELKRKLRIPLRREFAREDELEVAVRGQLKHVKEGTSLWEVEYKRLMEDVKRRKGL
jgi:hypothetical protein